ncbi:unnamed protein product [Paramecium sonneborni]|uniref:Uncharacterized protein n=1 Tax=Paramecium sonneborni TaxID=65129 RepID=A0A8S1KP94_9CILI|nr:unnamed protein product [Paramecium sonneborni]
MQKYHQQVKCNPFQHKLYQFLWLVCQQYKVFLNYQSVFVPMSTIFLNNQDRMQDERKATPAQNQFQFYQEQSAKMIFIFSKRIHLPRIRKCKSHVLVCCDIPYFFILERQLIKGKLIADIIQAPCFREYLK